MTLSTSDLFYASLGWIPVLSVGSNSPPGGPSTGDRHVVGTSGSGGWAGLSNNIVRYTGSAWASTSPNAGNCVFNSPNRTVYGYNGSAWSAVWESGLPLSGGVMTGALATTPTGFSITAGAVSLNTTVANDFQQTDTIVADTVITLTNGVSGYQGSVSIKQDGTGHAVTFAAAGRTIKYSGGSVPTTADAVISCGYLFTTVNSTAYLFIYPVEMI